MMRSESWAWDRYSQVNNTVISLCWLPRCLGGRRHAPEFDGPVQAGRGDPFPVGAEGHTFDPARMAVKCAHFVVRSIPDLDGRIRTAPGQHAAIFGMERQAFHSD